MSENKEQSDGNIMAPRSSADVPISDFSHLYSQPDPRAYYQSLGALDYRTPDHVQQLARWCLTRQNNPDTTPWVIDVGCGYGVNGAGLLCQMPVHELMDRYCSEDMAAMSSSSVISQDASLFSDRRSKTCRIAGLDVSRASLDYGLRVGLLDAAFDDDLTQIKPSDELARIARNSALIIESGVPIFIAPYVIDALLSATDGTSQPWIITAPPRYTNVAVYNEVLAQHGYVMEQATDTPLPHRCFESTEEGERIIAQQTEMGLDCTIEKESGYIHSNLYLARPQSAKSQPVDFTPVVGPVVRALGRP